MESYMYPILADDKIASILARGMNTFCFVVAGMTSVAASCSTAQILDSVSSRRIDCFTSHIFIAQDLQWYYCEANTNIKSGYGNHEAIKTVSTTEVFNRLRVA